MAYNSQFGSGFPHQQQQQRSKSLHTASRTSSPRAPSLAASDQGALQQQQQMYYHPADAALLHQAPSTSPSTPPQFVADQFTQQQYAMYVHQKKLAQLQHQQQYQQQMMLQQSPTTPPFQPVMQSYQQAPIQPLQQWYGNQAQFDPNYQPYASAFQPAGFGPPDPQYQHSDQGSRRPPLQDGGYTPPSQLGFTIRRQSLPSHQILAGPPSLASSADVVTRNAALAQDSFYALMKSRPDGGGYGSGYGSGGGGGGGVGFVAAQDPYSMGVRQDVGDVGAQGNQPPPVDWFHMPEPAASSHPSTDDGTGSVPQFPIDAHAVPRAATLLRSAVSMGAMSMSSESTNSTHPLIRHSPSDPVPGLMAGRPVVELVVLLGPRGSRAPSLLAQLQAQMPPEQFPQLRLVGSAANRYAGVGEYWDAAQAQVMIEGNVPLGKSVKRLRGASARADKVREYVERHGDISMPMMGLMTATCEDLCSSTSEMAVDFEGEGGLVAILATCAGWSYKGSDGAATAPGDIEPVWEKQFTVSSRVAQVRVELVEPITDFVTPFASAMCARSRARAGDLTSAMMTLLTYETRHGGPKIAHWVVLRSWGCGSGALRTGDSLDAAWVSAEAAGRGTPASAAALVAAGSTSAPEALDLSLIPDTRGAMSWTLFARVAPPLQLAHSAVSGRPGVVLKAGEYVVLAGLEAGARTELTQMDALARVITAVGSKTALAACGYPHMPDGITPQAFRDMCQFTTRRSRVALSALAGIMMARGKKEAIRALLSAVSLAGRMGDRFERQPVAVRPCAGGFLVHSAALDAALPTPADPSSATWLALSGSKIRLVLVCSGDRGDIVCYGTATFVGNLDDAGAVEGAGATIC